MGTFCFQSRFPFSRLFFSYRLMSFSQRHSEHSHYWFSHRRDFWNCVSFFFSPILIEFSHKLLNAMCWQKKQLSSIMSYQTKMSYRGNFKQWENQVFSSITWTNSINHVGCVCEWAVKIWSHVRKFHWIIIWIESHLMNGIKNFNNVHHVKCIVFYDLFNTFDIFHFLITFALLRRCSYYTFSHDSMMN